MATWRMANPLIPSPSFSIPLATPLAVKRAEVNRVFASIRQKLQQTEDRIITNLEKSYLVTGTETIQSELEKLYVSKSSLEQNMKDPNLAPALGAIQEKLQKDINRLEKKLKPEVSILWREHECEKAIENICEIKLNDSISAYMLKNEPICSVVKQGIERHDLSLPNYLTVERTTDNIYVSDFRNNRIQVYNKEGNHYFQLALPEGLAPLSICLALQDVFVLAKNHKEFSLVKISTTEIETLTKELDIISRKRSLETREKASGYVNFNKYPAYALHRIYERYLSNSVPPLNIIIVFIYEKEEHLILTKCIEAKNLCEPKMKLEVESKIFLKSIHIQHKTNPVSMQTKGESIDRIQLYVLYRDSTHCIHTFNLKGELVRAVISIEQMPPLCAFYLDYKDNIIICMVKEPTTPHFNTPITTSTTCSVYSIYGDLLHTWTYSTAGVTKLQLQMQVYDSNLSLFVNSNSQLVLLNPKQSNNILQIV